MKIALINMPFADVNRPALNLTQLKFRLDQADCGETTIYYLNQDFGTYFGLDLFAFISANYTTGIGDWIFRSIAFPDEMDNAKKYLRRQFPQRDEGMLELLNELLAKREGLKAYMETLVDHYRLDEAELVGFTSMFSQNVASFAMAKMLKDRNPDVVITMGGANCETPMGEVLVKNVPQLDFVFSGPGLISFPEFAECLDIGDMDGCHEIKGVFSKENVDELGKRMRVGEELPLDEPIELDYSAFLEGFGEHYPDFPGKKVLTFETSRGCWWGERSHCTFCGLNGDSMGYRSMSPGVALDQFTHIFKYSEDFSSYACVDNILPRNYFREVLPKLDPPNNIEIFYEVKADLKAQDLELLSEKRVKSIQPGIEALNSTTLKLMRKGTSAFGNVAFLKNCSLYDVSPEWNLLVGFPGEPEAVFEKYHEDIPKLLHLPPPSGCFPVRFDRFSPYFMQADHYGLDLKAYDFYKDVYPFDEAAISDMAYYFQNRDYGADFTRGMIRWIGKLQSGVAQWNTRWDNDENAVFPELFMEKRGAEHWIYDSRSGKVNRYQLDRVSVRALEILEKPKALSSLASGMKDIPDFDPEAAVACLGDRDLLFKEGTRYLSLVLSRPGSRLSNQRQFTHN